MNPISLPSAAVVLLLPPPVGEPNRNSLVTGILLGRNARECLSFPRLLSTVVWQKDPEGRFAQVICFYSSTT